MESNLSTGPALKAGSLSSQIQSEINSLEGKKGTEAYKALLLQLKEDVDKAEAQKNEKLLAAYRIFFTTLMIDNKYSSDLQSNGLFFIKNQQNFEASLKALCERYLPSLASAVASGQPIPQDLLQKISSLLVIVASTYQKASAIFEQQNISEALHILGMQDLKGNYFFERPRGRDFSGQWGTSGTEFVDYAIMYGSGKVKESRAVRETRNAIHEFFKDSSLSISERYSFYLSLVELFSKSPTLAYRLISEAQGSTLKEKFLNAFEKFNQSYGARYGQILLPEAHKGALHELQPLFYSSLESFKSAKAQQLRRFFGEDVTEDKFDNYIRENFTVKEEGENKGKFSAAMLNSALERANSATTYYYSSVISALAGEPTNKTWTVGQKTVQDVNNNGKIDAFELLPYFSDAELRSAAVGMVQSKANAFQQWLEEAKDLVDKLRKIDPASSSKTQASDRLAVLVDAGILKEITKEEYKGLSSAQKRLAFEFDGKYFQLTDAGKDAIRQIDPDLTTDADYENVVKIIKKGLGKKLISDSKAVSDYAWLGNLLLYPLYINASSNAYWIKGKSQESQEAAYIQALSNLKDLSYPSSDYPASSVLELALFNASKQQPDLALENALLYKNGNQQTPRTKEELESLLPRLQNKMNAEELVRQIRSIDGGQGAEENQQQDQNTTQGLATLMPLLQQAIPLLQRNSSSLGQYFDENGNIKPEYIKKENEVLKLNEEKIPPSDLAKINALLPFRRIVFTILNKYFDENGAPKQDVQYDPSDEQALRNAIDQMNRVFSSQ